MLSKDRARPPLTLVALIAGVTVVPLLILVWLGWRLLEQDVARRDGYEPVPSPQRPIDEMALQESNTIGNRHFRDVLRAKGYDVTYRRPEVAMSSYVGAPRSATR
jgi:hypothetical protein